jgi:anti-sigma factor ChrR (cupin superfamily)
MESIDRSELMALYAIAAAEDAENSVVEGWLLDSADTQTELAELQSVVEAIAYNIPAIEPPPSLKARLFQRIAEEEHTPPPSIETLTSLMETATWEPTPISGVSMATLSIDREQREIQYFVRILGSVEFPKHRHADCEEVVVLEGEILFDGVPYGVGDRLFSEPGSSHRPQTQQPCTIFVKTSLDDEML